MATTAEVWFAQREAERRLALSRIFPELNLYADCAVSTPGTGTLPSEDEMRTIIHGEMDRAVADYAKPDWPEGME